MPRRNIILSTVTFLSILLLACGAFAQQRAQAPAAGQQEGQRGRGQRVTRAPLFFREVWKQTPAGGEHPVDIAQALSNSGLELKLYGPTGKEILMTGAETDENN